MVVLSITHNPAGPFLTHKATTFGGSSGAPLFKVVQGEPVVVALHCGCVPPIGPPQLNGGMLIAHILHHIFNGSFKEGRLIVSFPFGRVFLVLCLWDGTLLAVGIALICADLPPLEKILKESAPAPAGGSTDGALSSGEHVITEYTQANSHVNFAVLYFCKVVCHIRLVWIPASRSVFLTKHHILAHLSLGIFPLSGECVGKWE